MKNKLLLLLLLILPSICVKGNLTVQCDQRYETLAVACRLANFKETQTISSSNIENSVDLYFSQYQNHELVSFLQTERESNPNCFQMLVDATSLMKISHSSISLDRSQSQMIERFKLQYPNFELKKWVKNMNHFYKKTKFESFFQQQLSENTKQVSKIKQYYDSKLNTERLNQIFGCSDGNCTVYYCSLLPVQYFPLKYDAHPSVLMGLFKNYESPNALSLESALVKGLAECSIDARSVENVMNTMVKWEQKIEETYPEIHNQSICQRTLDCLSDWALILYYSDANKSQFLMQKMDTKMYLWQERLYDFLIQNFPEESSFASFLPEIVTYFSWCEGQSSKIIDEYNHRNPYVVSIYPVPGLPLDLSKDVITFTITFSKDMLPTRGQGWLCKNPSQLKRKSVQGITAQEWKDPSFSILGTHWLDKRTCIIELSGEEARNAGLYGFILPMNTYSDRFGITFEKEIIITY